MTRILILLELYFSPWKYFNNIISRQLSSADMIRVINHIVNDKYLSCYVFNDFNVKVIQH